MNKQYYHRQDKEDYCGPASIQIVSNYLSDKLPKVGTFKQQSTLVSSAGISQHKAPWDWDKYKTWKWQPDEMQKMLVKCLKLPASAVIYPTISLSDSNYSFDFIGDYKSGLVDHLTLSKCPIVPIHGSFHYDNKLIPPSIYSAIVEKLIFNDDDHNIDDSVYVGHWIVLTEYQNDSFIGFDPWLPKLYGAPVIDPPHIQSVVGKGGIDCECPEVYIHVSGDTDALKLNFPDESRVAIVWEAPQLVSKPRTPSKIDNTPPLRRSGKCINKSFDAQSLFDQMAAFGLRKQPPCNAYLEKVTISSPNTKPKFNMGTPRLVRRLDAFCNDYYLVPLLKVNRPGEIAPGASTVLARVDAPSKLYLDSLYYSENPLLIDEISLPMPPLPNSPKTQKDLIDTYVPEQLMKMGKPRWIDPFTKQIQDKENPPELVWLPCKQSISPFFPFFVISAGAEKFLVRIDGAVFQKLSY